MVTAVSFALVRLIVDAERLLAPIRWAPVFTRPGDLDIEAIGECVAAGWGFDVVSLEYQAVGFGSHHWLATSESGDTRFVTVDDLRAKRRSREDTEDAAFKRLAAAFAAVVALRDRAGLQFVVAALPDMGRRILTRLTDRYSLVVHPLLAGRPAGSHGGYESPADRDAVLDLLVQLHSATEATPSTPIATIFEFRCAMSSTVRSSTRTSRGTPAPTGSERERCSMFTPPRCIDSSTPTTASPPA